MMGLCGSGGASSLRAVIRVDVAALESHLDEGHKGLRQHEGRNILLCIAAVRKVTDSSQKTAKGSLATVQFSNGQKK